jgi:predicted RNase H-like HicB family nuclease
MDQPKYHIDIFWSDEDGGYIANVPALRYCSAFGESYEEALREVLVAMELHLDTLRELDHPIPEPTSPGVSKVLRRDDRESARGGPRAVTGSSSQLLREGAIRDFVEGIWGVEAAEAAKEEVARIIRDDGVAR